MNAHGATTATGATAVVTHRQCSTAMAAMMPPGASPEVTLVATRKLLHNPPSAHSSPSTVEQWRHDVDELVIAAINTMPHGGRQENRLGGVPVPSAAHSCSPWLSRAHWWHRARRWQYVRQVSLQQICELNSSIAAQVRTVASPSSASGRGATARVVTSRGTSVRWTPPLSGKLLAPLRPRRDLGVAAWCFPHTSTWWSGRASFGLHLDPHCKRE
jgi:hypothetical protein